MLKTGGNRIARRDEFVRTLSAAEVYFLIDEDLYIDLKYDTGTMRFLRQQKES
jgi:hypothetical protein